jgi:hypothetical protein
VVLRPLKIMTGLSVFRAAFIELILEQFML